MTTRPTGACLVLVTQVNMVRGPHPTEYCCEKLRAAPGRAEVALSLMLCSYGEPKRRAGK